MTPSSTRSLLVGSAAAAVALAGLDGGIAGWAQWSWTRAAAAQDIPAQLYSLPRHVIAMVLLAALAVAVATVLAEGGNRVLAGLVLAATVAGPMTVIAAPVRAGLITADSGDVGWWWHAAIGVPQLAIMLAATVWAVRCRRPAAPGTTARSGLGSAGTSFAIFAAIGLTGQILLLPNPQTSEHPGLLTAVGWAFLGAGLALVAARSASGRAPALALIAALAVVASLLLAYHRPGGWPGVAGWEFNGMEPPIVLSPAAVATFLAGPVIALGGQARRRIVGLAVPAPGAGQ